jgi:hypothetical protein
MKHLAGAALLSLAIALSGCASIKKLTGQRDDSVLPGQREDVLPPEKQIAQDPKVRGKQPAGGAQAECLPDDLNCVSKEPPAQDTFDPEAQ